MKLLRILYLLPKLGLLNVLRVLWHQILMKTELHPVCRLKAAHKAGDFFIAEQQDVNLQASRAWLKEVIYFDWLKIEANGSAPNWFSRPITGLTEWPSKMAWWKTLSPEIEKGDIKEIWELSRFHWIIPMSQRAANGDALEVRRLNDWIYDWVNKNTYYLGPNWRCAQEASIRVMNLAVGSLILNQIFKPQNAMLDFLRAHLARISSTISYAIAQDNNHGILEAAALYIGGEWLSTINGDAQSRAWAKKGRKWLENRSRKLISKDGSFSMYSLTYHREFLDALSLVEVYRRLFKSPQFTQKYAERAEAAALWLKAFVNSETGDAPNLGANDGTRLFQFAESGYRDFRPSVQLATVLFCKGKAYIEGAWDAPLHWMHIPIPSNILPVEASKQFDDAGFAILRDCTTNTEVFVRYPRFRFRPSQPDLLHVDLWIGNENILRDDGSYSYSIDGQLLNYFGRTRSHNTIEFDGRDQMSHISRFLIGEWRTTKYLEPIHRIEDSQKFVAGYSDGKGASHIRQVILKKKRLMIVDYVKGFANKAVLRWRLKAAIWNLSVTSDFCSLITIMSEGIKITISSSVPITRSELVEGWESRFYFHKSLLPVLEVEIESAGIITTKIDWAQ